MKMNKRKIKNKMMVWMMLRLSILIITQKSKKEIARKEILVLIKLK